MRRGLTANEFRANVSITRSRFSLGAGFNTAQGGLGLQERRPPCCEIPSERCEPFTQAFEMHGMMAFESVIVADCPFSIALEYVSSYMQRFGDNNDAVAMVRLPLRTFGLPLPGSLRHRVRIQFEDSVDIHERNRSHRGLKFHWAAGNPLLPDLHGVLSFRIAADSRIELVLTGAYAPPLGRIGLLFNNLMGNRIALATGKALLERIAADMERQERDFRAVHSAG